MAPSLLVGVLVGVGPSPARAAEVTFAFTGTIDLILPRGDLPESVTEGDVVTGRVTFDSEAEGMFGGPGTESYLGVCGVEAQVEDLSFSGEEDPDGPPSGIVVRDEALGAFNDGFSLQIFSVGDISQFNINLLAEAGTNAIEGTGLPTAPPDLGRATASLFACTALVALRRRSKHLRRRAVRSSP